MKVKFCVAAAFGLASAAANAAPFTVYDARSAGMAGVGVASSHISSAPFFNPAMLAAQRFEDDFAVFAGVGILGADADGVLDDIDDFQAAMDANNLGDAEDALRRADGKGLFVQANAAASVGFSGINWAGALSANAYAVAETWVDASSPTSHDGTLEFNGLEVTEIGLSLGRKFGDFSFGVTPKMMAVKSYTGSESLRDNIDDLGDVLDAITEQGEVDHGSDLNVDLGMVYRLTNRWQLGLVHRNAISQDYKNNKGETLSLEPQTRAGIAYNGSVLTFGVDYDLVENDSLTDKGDKSQMLAAGAEIDIFDFLQLRAGYATNLADTRSKTLDQYSLGVGLQIIAVHVDIAAIGNENSISAYAQAGIRF